MREKENKTHQEGTKDGEQDRKKIDIKPKWAKIVLTGFITSLLFLVLDIIVVLILIFALQKEPLLTLGAFEYVLLGEIGVIVLWGACIGNFGQSIVVQKIKEKVTKTETLNKYTIKESTFNAFSYYFGGAFILCYLLVLHKIIQIIVQITG